jgi:hypothetical protein
VEDFLIGFLGRIGESGEGGKRARSERVRPKRGNQTREENEGPFLSVMIIRVWVSDICQLFDLMNTSIGIIFYSWVTYVSDLN